MIIRSSRLQEETNVVEENNKLILTKTEDISPVLAHNYELRKDSQDGWSKDRSYRHVASIPFPVWLEWTKRYPELVHGDKELKDKLTMKLIREREAEEYRTVNKI